MHGRTIRDFCPEADGMHQFCPHQNNGACVFTSGFCKMFSITPDLIFMFVNFRRNKASFEGVGGGYRSLGK